MKENEKKVLYKINNIIKKTYNKNSFNDIDLFSGFYKMYKHKFKKPVLVSSTDGVGTKICLLINYKKYKIIGIDCFAMCINDILCHGAQPLFFLDYLSCNNIYDKIIEQIIQGIAYTCKKYNICFIGGETAEMPGIYSNNNNYDVVGFCVGIVEKNKLINGKKLIKEKDIIIGFPSTGIHSNGFSIIRKIFSKNDFDKKFFDNKPLYESLIIPTKIYYDQIYILLKKFSINGIAHITGGGILHNLSRIIPEKLSALIKKKYISIPYIFKFIQKIGNLSDKIMWETFNMGVGMIIVVPLLLLDSILNELKNIKENYFILGKIIKGNKKVVLK